MKPIKNIIFDIGNVLFKYDPHFITESLLPKSPHKEFYVNELFDSPIWQSLDRGDIRPIQAIEKIKSLHSISPEQEKDLQFLISNFSLHLILNEDMKNIFEKNSTDYNLYILSNFQEESFQLLVQKYPFLKKAKGTVISSKINMKKPELGIFHYLLTQYSIIPQESIFIDDLKENITSAEQLLIKGIHFISAEQTKKHLSKFNINV
ncbi:hypothetical protein DID78_00315 [Candidatus Marinamargulisbacteria bacterium SCGC AG-343-D04]|nr:hypothetical protein DID78_00315 [Candidatus Marinamargulisbacteria bacterium SCGC AG-343-D04]